MPNKRAKQRKYERRKMNLELRKKGRTKKQIARIKKRMLKKLNERSSG